MAQVKENQTYIVNAPMLRNLFYSDQRERLLRGEETLALARQAEIPSGVVIACLGLRENVGLFEIKSLPEDLDDSALGLVGRLFPMSSRMWDHLNES